MSLEIDLTINNNIEIKFLKSTMSKDLYFIEFNSFDFKINITLNYSDLQNLKYQIGCL